LPAAAQLRVQIENTLSARIPSALTPQARRERPVVPTGIASLDELLAGGLPVGAITEIVGPACSGRTSCTLAFLAQVMSAGQVCAWVDASDSFDPESAAANGVDLHRLLWVRCGEGQAAAMAATASPPAEPSPASCPEPIPSGGSPHPRSEARGLPQAVEAFLHKTPYRDKSIGTPGAPNRAIAQHPAQASPSRKEQVAFDRLPARRGEHIVQHHSSTTESISPNSIGPRCAEPQRREPPAKKDLPLIATLPPPGDRPGFRKPGFRKTDRWQRLDQALRATDLLMQAGGFGAVVLDLGDIPPETVNRIPLATWFRYRAAADRTRSSFLLLTRYPCAQSSAEVLLRTSVSMPEPGTVMLRVPFTVELVRQRFRSETNIYAGTKKPPQSAAAWTAQPAWVGGTGVGGPRVGGTRVGGR
jgi:recombination protein RecA